MIHGTQDKEEPEAKERSEIVKTLIGIRGKSVGMDLLLLSNAYKENVCCRFALLSTKKLRTN